MKIFKFLKGLVGFGNLCFAEIKSHPSAYQTCELSECRFPHSKICWNLGFPRYSLSRLLEGLLTGSADWNIVWNHCLWCWEDCGIVFCSIWNRFFFSFVGYVYMWDFLILARHTRHHQTCSRHHQTCSRQWFCGSVKHQKWIIGQNSNSDQSSQDCGGYALRLRRLCANNKSLF